MSLNFEELVARLRSKLIYHPTGEEFDDVIDRLQQENAGLRSIERALMVKFECAQERELKLQEENAALKLELACAREVGSKLIGQALHFGVEEGIVAAQSEVDRLQQICAAAYQLAGSVGAPMRFLDALSDPGSATQKQIDALLPLDANEIDCERHAQRFELELEEARKDSDRLRLLLISLVNTKIGKDTIYRISIGHSIDHEEVWLAAKAVIAARQ